MAEKGFVDESGKFHCPCGASHNRGPLLGASTPSATVYRCLRCGKSYRVLGVVQLRTAAEAAQNRTTTSEADR